MEETGVHREKQRPAVRHWQTLSHNVVSSTPRHEQDSNCVGRKSNLTYINRHCSTMGNWIKKILIESIQCMNNQVRSQGLGASEKNQPNYIIQQNARKSVPSLVVLYSILFFSEPVGSVCFIRVFGCEYIVNLISFCRQWRKHLLNGDYQRQWYMANIIAIR